MTVSVIVSGGQTGADSGGLAAALSLGLPTCGWAPVGFLTEDGPAPWLMQLNLWEAPKGGGYRERTVLNVRTADGSLLFGDDQSRGSRLLLKTSKLHERPVFRVRWQSGEVLPGQSSARAFRRWIKENDIQMLNVAGNRESGQPGIRDMTRDFLILALS